MHLSVLARTVASLGGLLRWQMEVPSMFLRFLMRGCLKISRPTKTETGTPTRPITAPQLTTRTS